MKIVVYIGNCWQRWDPDSVKLHGSGGSEIAVINMCRLLHLQGNEVTVYGMPVKESVYDGVTYLDHSKYKNLECDLLLSSRNPWAVDAHFNIKFKKSILWMHDAHMGTHFSPERLEKFDKVFALSNWHANLLKQMYPFLPPEKIIITSNGIDTSLYNKHIPKKYYKLIYSSSPNRGLDVLLNIWQDMIKIIPFMELHVYYGFDILKLTLQNNPEELKKISNLENLCKTTTNVFLHGRVCPEELADAQLSSGIWAYPTSFYETSCITAMEAQAAGLDIITTPIGALPETIGNNGTFVNGDSNSRKYQNEFKEKLFQAILKPNQKEKLLIKKYAKDNFDWQHVANKWSTIINDLFIGS